MPPPHGAVSAWLQAQGDWAADERAYTFPLLGSHGVVVEATKRPDKTLYLTIDGLPRGQ